MRHTQRWSAMGLLFLVGTWAGPLVAGTIIDDATSAFSVTNGNPNGHWTYGYETAGGNPFIPYTAHSGNAWLGNIGPDATPAIWKNDSASVAYGVAPGQISLHPGPSYQPALLRWTAPAGIAATIQINGQFFAGDTGIMQVGVFRNNDWVSPLFQAADSGTFSLTTTVATGDTIDFAVYGGYGWGNTPIDARISATTTTGGVPEPSTLVLAAVAGLCRVSRTWRRQRQRRIEASA